MEKLRVRWANAPQAEVVIETDGGETVTLTAAEARRLLLDLAQATGLNPRLTDALERLAPAAFLVTRGLSQMDAPELEEQGGARFVLQGDALDLREAVAVLSRRFPWDGYCGVCFGFGAYDLGQGARDCAACEGTGQALCYGCLGARVRTKWGVDETCFVCAGTGRSNVQRRVRSEERPLTEPTTSEGASAGR